MIAALATGASASIEELTVELRCETGRAFLEQNLLEQARTEFLSALELDPECSEAVLGLGWTYYLQGALANAETYFERFLELSPDDNRGREALASLLLEAGRHQDALGIVETALDLDPSEPALWLLRSEAALGSGDTLLAEQSLSRLLQVGGESEFEARTMLAAVLRSRDMYSEARELLLTAADQGYAPAQAGLARIYLNWGDYMRAADAITAYLLLSPEGDWADSARIILDEMAASGDYIPPQAPGND
jgi:tetratricopeptide (TPR) repeat protein